MLLTGLFPFSPFSNGLDEQKRYTGIYQCVSLVKKADVYQLYELSLQTSILDQRLFSRLNLYRYPSMALINQNSHYGNTPIQIYRKFHLQKLKIFR